MDFLKQEGGYGSWWMIIIVAFIAYQYGKKSDKCQEKEPEHCCETDHNPCCDNKSGHRCHNNPYHDDRRGRHCNRFW